ncbi:replication factor C subunit 1 [Cyclospora cayetanensis]|uniref:Replication factor C subunit 1 n=1 Tax=Cyclospora cayetanensis TaxID=88456 RepID=A0A6P6RVV9_9EIME|nr:replication factor C subunit 1 [Cyclospora cayetanensis]
MADIRSFFAPEGFTTSQGKEFSNASLSNKGSKSSKARASHSPRKATASAAQPERRKSAPVAAAKSSRHRRGEAPEKRGRSKVTPRPNSSSSSSSSDSSSDSEKSEAHQEESDGTSSSEEETLSPPKTASAARKGGRLRRVVVSDSDEECAEVESLPQSENTGGGSGKKSNQQHPQTQKQRKGFKGTRCVVLEPGESESEEEQPRIRRGKGSTAPAVTLDKFLKSTPSSGGCGNAGAAALPNAEQQKKNASQRIEVDVDSFFAAAATKELQKHKKKTPSDAKAPPAPAATAAVGGVGCLVGKRRRECVGLEAWQTETSLYEAQSMWLCVVADVREDLHSPKIRKRRLSVADDRSMQAAAPAPKSPKRLQSKKLCSSNTSSSSNSTSDKPLAGMKLVLTGVLKQMPREVAAERIVAAGGSVTTAVSGKTNYLVVGAELEDGRPVESGMKHRKATELQQKGGNIRIIREEEFLEMLGGVAHAASSAPLKSAAEKAAPAAANRAASAAALPSLPAAAALQVQDSRWSVWAEKYRPQTPEEFVGNEGPFQLLLQWLRDWHDVCIKGIGKTTAAAVAARRYGFQLLEFNASDSRNKAHIEELQDLVTGGVTVNFFKLDKNGKTTPTASGAAAAHGEGKFPCLLLDEVDGLSGGDRGGSQAMLKLIDTTRIPIICVCNDRMSTKVRTIASRCLDLRFEKPTLALLRARMQQIAAAEDLVVSDETLSRIAEISGGDMRQCVGQLQLLATQMRHRKLGGAALSAGKDAQVTLGPFECCKLLLDSRTGSKMKLWEKVDMFFVDYDMLPLLIQENYLTAIGQGLHQQLGNTSSLHSWDSHGTLGTAPSPELCALESSAKASRALCLADRANAVLRSNQEWSLLPTMAAFCCVDVPAEAVAPLACGGDPKATVERLSTYGLRREHLVDHMQSLMLRKQARLYESVESKSKAAFTRLCSSLLQQQTQIHCSKSKNRTQSLKEVIYATQADL